MTRVEQQLDKVADSVANIDKTLAAQAVELKEHMRRTEALETVVGHLNEWFQRFKGIAALVGFGITVAELIHSFWR